MAKVAVCKRCGRPLKDAFSIALGVGPECRGGASKAASRHQIKRAIRAGRTAAYRAGEPVEIGVSTRTGMPVVYTPSGDGWVSQEGRRLSNHEFERYLLNYGLIDSSTVSDPV